MAETNPNSRLEAFCDGVFAIALTLLIIDIKIPHTEFENTSEFWLAIKKIIPSILIFVLSFTIILITWVNHHGAIKLVSKTSASLFYANGFLLLTVVFMPFPTALLGEYIMTDHSSPAVVIYNSTLALQAIGWVLIFNSILKNHLEKNEKSIHAIRQNRKYGYFSVVLYSVFAILAIWFPQTIAFITIVSWIFWLILGINMKHE
jgi:uncharacterized membrane protein